jgi:hypothetical protein
MSINNKIYRNEFQIKLNQKNQEPKESFCNTCNAGPWGEDEKGSDGKSIVGLHMKLKHDVVEYMEPKLRGKTNWGNTEIEKEFTKFFNEDVDKWRHSLIASDKDSTNICLIKDRSKWENQK